MTLKINDSGTWKEPTKVSVKDGGAWKEVLTASVKDGGSWKPFYQRKFTYTVSSNVNKLDLDTVLSSDNKLGDVDVVINSGVYVYSDSTGTPALLTGSGVAGVLTIINNGYIYGIYTYQNDEIVNVSWFNCENQRDYYFKGVNDE